MFEPFNYHNQCRRVRDVLEGSDRVKARGEMYLPRLSGQTDEEYFAYRMRANFFNMSALILKINLSMITKSPPRFYYTANPLGSQLHSTANSRGSQRQYVENDDEFLKIFFPIYTSVASELISIGRVGIFVNNIAANNSSVDSAFTIIPTESVFVDDDGTVTVGNRIFQTDQSGVIVATSGDGADVTQFIYNSRPLTDYPFTIANAYGLSVKAIKPPLLDVVDINLSHYRTSADLEHGRHFTGLPTPVITGAKVEGHITVGSEKAIVLPPTGAKAYFLEFKGEGLEHLSKALKEKQAQASYFSSRLQDTSIRGSESKEAVSLRYASDMVTLYSISLASEQLINESIRFANKYFDAGLPYIETNKSFTTMSRKDIKLLTEKLLDGSITMEEFDSALAKGGL